MLNVRTVYGMDRKEEGGEGKEEPFLLRLQRNRAVEAVFPG